MIDAFGGSPNTTTAGVKPASFTTTASAKQQATGNINKPRGEYLHLEEQEQQEQEKNKLKNEKEKESANEVDLTQGKTKSPLASEFFDPELGGSFMDSPPDPDTTRRMVEEGGEGGEKDEEDGGASQSNMMNQTLKDMPLPKLDDQNQVEGHADNNCRATTTVVAIAEVKVTIDNIDNDNNVKNTTEQVEEIAKEKKTEEENAPTTTTADPTIGPPPPSATTTTTTTSGETTDVTETTAKPTPLTIHAVKKLDNDGASADDAKEPLVKELDAEQATTKSKDTGGKQDIVGLETEEEEEEEEEEEGGEETGDEQEDEEIDEILNRASSEAHTEVRAHRDSASPVSPVVVGKQPEEGGVRKQQEDKNKMKTPTTTTTTATTTVTTTTATTPGAAGSQPQQQQKTPPTTTAAAGAPGPLAAQPPPPCPRTSSTGIECERTTAATATRIAGWKTFKFNNGGSGSGSSGFFPGVTRNDAPSHGFLPVVIR